ncbi:MAG: sulfatase-like hydrolase/transferase [Fulvivirga sp.]|uniref:LTA synthase family protein n=1 Tax=Fulvivirga sp. TaxID=1931237 RepID=UPI0032F078C4
MTSRIKLFFSYCLFWFSFFVIARVIFLTYHYPLTDTMGLGDILLAMLNGARLDLTVMGYFSLIPGLLICLTTYFKPIVLDIILRIYTGLMLFIASFIIVLDLELYTHWSYRMDATPLLYIGKEAASSGDFWTTVIMVTFWLILFGAFSWAYIKYVSKRTKNIATANWKTSITMLLLTALLIAPIRGTVGVAPINTGTVYFHESNMFANHAAINVVYNFGYALRKLNRLSYPENYLAADKTQLYFNEMNESSGETVKLIDQDQPNIIIIVLESYTFRFIEPLGGLPGITPNINKLVHEGVLFDNFYSSGDRTDLGIVSILNGYPRQPKGSIIKFPKKTASLPFINKTLKSRGYNTEFTYGYNIDYANFKSYLSNAQFDGIAHSQDFPQELNTSKWGVHDHFVFDKFLDEANQINSPFFKIMMTQSSHEPFEVPMETVIEGKDDVSKFLNSAYYTDKSLGEFIDKAKQTDWWTNSWVIVTADHGHFMPDNPGNSNADRFKIPMLWLGGALAKQDTVIHSYASQTDIANTIFGQLGFQDEDFMFSKNIMTRDYKPYAVYVFNNGFGYLDSTHKIVFDNVGGNYLMKEGATTEKELELGKAYMQTLYSDFNKR